jgi:hypothetical protein
MKKIEITSSGSVGIMPLGWNPTQKLDVKGKLSLKSKLILFYKKYFK